MVPVTDSLSTGPFQGEGTPPCIGLFYTGLSCSPPAPKLSPTMEGNVSGQGWERLLLQDVTAACQALTKGCCPERKGPKRNLKVLCSFLMGPSEEGLALTFSRGC